jgi:hypothetical protein
VFVDPARTRLIQKSAGALRVGITVCEQICMMASNVFRLDFENREIVDTALMATPAAL